MATGIPAETPPGAAPEPSLAERGISGVAWNWGGSIVLIVAQVASTAATARLVIPAEFGLYASAQAAAGFTGFFTLKAVGPGLQRRAELGPAAAGTAMTISLVASFLVAAVLFIGAAPWADLWGVPEATWAVRVLAIATFLTSIATVPIALIRRDLHFRRAMGIEIGSLVVGMGAGVTLAALHGTAVALAAGQAIGSACLLVAAGLPVQHRVRPAYDRAEARELATFAGQVGGLGFVAYFTNTLPSWFAARAFGPATLGFYSRANLVVALPAEYALTSVFKVLYPLYGRVHGDARRTRALVEEGLTMTTGFVWPAFGTIAGAAPVIVAVLLGDRWDAAVPFLALSAVIVSAWVPCGLLTNAAEAFGWMRVIALRQAVLVAGVAGTLLAAHLTDASLEWVLAGVAVSEWAVYLLTIRPFLRHGLLDAAYLLRTHAIHLAVAAAAFGAAAGMARLLGDSPLAFQLAGQVVVAMILAMAILAGRRWLPAVSVLARRVGAQPGESLVRAAWAAVR